jgi:hypothetical protein
MAGSYPDYASWRMPIDRDGTQLWLIGPTGNLAQRANSELVTLNNENNDAVPRYASNAESATLIFMFPELRDIDGWTWIHGNSSVISGLLTVATSANTTNGVDGTWTTVTTFTPTYAVVSPTYRTVFTAGTANGVKAIRFVMAAQSSRYMEPNTIHLFGEITAGQNPNRLILWHPTLDQRVGPAHFDWGDVRRGSAATDKTFRVKNNSATLTANGVDVSFDVLTDASPTLLTGQHSLSLDGTSFAQTQTLGNLAPGAISGIVTLRRTMAFNAALSVWALRVVADATSWA